MKFLWVAPRWPFPVDDGAKQATAALLLPLANLGHTIEYIALCSDDTLAASPHKNIKLIKHFKINRKNKILRALKNLSSDLPLSTAPFVRASEGFSWESLDSKPDFVVVDCLHSYGALIRNPCPWPIVYRSHNVEGDLWQQATNLAPLFFRPYFQMQANRVKRLELELVKKSMATAAISDSDAAQFRTSAPNGHIISVHTGFDFTESSPLASGPLTLGFLGKLDWPPNKDGLEWFLDKVWLRAHAARPEIQLQIAGSGDSKWLSPYLQLPGIKFLGKIPTIEPFYQNVHAVIAPIRFGGGTKIKLVEASRFGRAALVQPHSLCGSELSESSTWVCSADPEAWVNAISEMTAEKLTTRGISAWKEAKKAFSDIEQAEIFLKLFDHGKPTI